MIVHVVMIQPRPDLEAGALAAVLADLRAAAKEIPSVRRLRIGRRVKHGRPGYETAMTRDFAYLALIEFDDERGLADYLEHPSHAALSRHFATIGEQALAYDYEVAEASDTPAW